MHFSKRRLWIVATLFCLLLVCLAPVTALQSILPYPDVPFQGLIRRTFKDSQPAFPKPVTAPKGAPNILLVLLDDGGFGQWGTFGGGIPTPNLDQLATEGLRYNHFHTTALCSPTRAALLTGRNHHSVGTGTVTELATGYPGYNSVIPKSAATIAEILKQNGYSTAMFGKHHNIPKWETGLLGPFDRWPTGLGFQYFYGFLGGHTSQWDPSLIENTAPVEKPNVPNYHLSTDLADHTIAWIQQVKSLAPDKPFFAYFAPGATHAPHQAPAVWIDKFKGQFDSGWDKYREETFERQKKLGIIPREAELTPRPKELPAWDSLSSEQQRLYARMMEAFAGFTAHTDYEIGRVIAAVKQLPDADNTLIIFITGDNGSSAEGGLTGTINQETFFNGIPADLKKSLSVIDEIGGPLHNNHFPAAWAWAMDTPFQWTKQVASHFGGTRNGMVISWPRRVLSKGGLRGQFLHVIDVAPTILEAVGLPQPTEVFGVKQEPMEGISFAYTLDGKNENAPSKHTTQYFEMLGNRAIYHDGWIASAKAFLPWEPRRDDFDLEATKWELYNIQDDFSQARDLSDRYPQKLKELQELFWQEAEKYKVLPLDYRGLARLKNAGTPTPNKSRNVFTYYTPVMGLSEAVSPDLKNKSFEITAEVEIPTEGAEGMLITAGGRSGGYGFFIRNGKLTYTYNYLGEERYTITSNESLPQGLVKLGFEFAYDGEGVGKGGTGKLYVNGRQVGKGRVEKTVPRHYGEGLNIAQDSGTPIAESYQVPFKFTGHLKRLTVQLKS